MFKLLSVVAITASVAYAQEAPECNATMTQNMTDTVGNGTFYSTCAAGATFNLSDMFAASNLSDADFFSFCNSSACLHPMHQMLHMPNDCLYKYKDTKRNLTKEVVELHDKCHVVKDAAKKAASANANASSPSPSPSSKSSAMMLTAKTLVATMVVSVTAVSMLL